MKDGRLHLRLSIADKEKLLLVCEKLGCNYTQYIVSKIADDLDFGSKKRIFDFLNKEDYFYSKVDNNINQIARIVNAEKQISEHLLHEHNGLLAELISISNDKKRIANEILKNLIK